MIAANRADLQNALRQAISAEFAAIPAQESTILYQFSETFDKRMARLIRTQKRSYWGLINTVAKQVAIICALMLTISLSAFSVKAIREPVVEFFRSVYATFIEYVFEGDAATTITYRYSLGSLPDGFYQTRQIANENRCRTIYKNDAGDQIELEQSIPNLTCSFDNEHGEVYLQSIEGREVQIISQNKVTTALWSQDGYVFLLTYTGQTDAEQITDLIRSME